MTDEITLYDQDGHRNILMEDVEHDIAVQANNHIIVHGDQALIIDPGGSKTFKRAFPETLRLLGRAKLTHILLSHQDPDIVAAVNGWLVSTDATAYVSNLWLRFVPHFGLNRLVAESLEGIGDEGTVMNVGGADLIILPAHFMHSCGNFQVYDPTSKILYTGDLGASVGIDYRVVEDFDAHLPSMEGFHRRYMGGNKVMRIWAATARDLDIDIIAPQHGALFRGPELVSRFIDWCEGLECGPDLFGDRFPIPGR